MKKNNKKIFKIMIIIFIIINMANYRVFATDNIVIDAKASLIVEKNTGKIIFENNAESQNYPASVTKILTAIIVLENCKLDDIATVSQSALSNIPEGYVITPLVVGEKMRIEDLLYALMLKSSNDAAYVLAEHVGGSINGFSELMNMKAKEIGCKNSHFVNPNGIHNENHYTTAYDMYLIAKYAMQNQDFAKIVSTYKYTLPATNKYLNNDRVMENTNSFINPGSKYYDKDVKGIKTGTTAQAGNCLITDVEKNGLEIITVVLGAETKDSKFSETNKMIEYMFDNYTLTEAFKSGDIVKKIEVEKATKETKDLNVLISDDIIVMNNVNINLQEIEPEIELNKNIVAPIQKGQEIGTIKYIVDGLEYNSKLLAGNDVVRKTYDKEIMLGLVATIFLITLIIVIKVKRKK